MTWPLRSTPITGASPLLQASPPARPATVLNPLRFTPLGELPVAIDPNPAGSRVGTRLPTFRANAADQARVAFMPDTTWPISGHPPGSSRSTASTPVSMPPKLVTTLQQRFACARLPDPHLTPHTDAFSPHRSPRQSSTNAAEGGLTPPPTGRRRRAKKPPSFAQHHIQQRLLHDAPFCVRDTPAV